MPQVAATYKSDNWMMADCLTPETMCAGEKTLREQIDYILRYKGYTMSMKELARYMQGRRDRVETASCTGKWCVYQEDRENELVVALVRAGDGTRVFEVRRSVEP